jgi:hypothetical protein
MTERACTNNIELYLVYHFEYDEYKNVYLIITYEDVNVPNVTLNKESVSLNYYKKRSCPQTIKDKFYKVYSFYCYTISHLFEIEKSGRYTYNDRT